MCNKNDEYANLGRFSSREDSSDIYDYRQKQRISSKLFERLYKKMYSKEIKSNSSNNYDWNGE